MEKCFGNPCDACGSFVLVSMKGSNIHIRTKNLKELVENGVRHPVRLPPSLARPGKEKATSKLALLCPVFRHRLSNSCLPRPCPSRDQPYRTCCAIPTPCNERLLDSYPCVGVTLGWVSAFSCVEGCALYSARGDVFSDYGGRYQSVELLISHFL